MAFRKMLPVVLLAALFAAPTAEARYKVGLGEQSASMFASPKWQSLKLKRSRYIVPWNWNKSAAKRAEVTAWMNAAHAARQQVLVAFGARNGCFNGHRYSKRKKCRAPSAKAYRRSFRAFDNAFPWVRTYSAWNEANHVSQPTFRKPKLAVRYYNVLRKEARARKFKVMALDVLDTEKLVKAVQSQEFDLVIANAGTGWPTSARKIDWTFGARSVSETRTSSFVAANAESRSVD